MENSTARLLKELGEHFPPSAIKQRSGGGGKMLSYVEGHTVIHRLNDATKGVWDFKVISLDWRDSLLLATVELTIPGLGTRQHIGIQEVKGGASDIVKGAITDALKKVCTLFGVGLELYGDDYAEEAKPPPPDPRFALLDAFAVKVSQLDLLDFAGDGSAKDLSRFVKSVSIDLGRVPADRVTVDDIEFAITNLARWNLERKTKAIAERGKTPLQTPHESLLNALSEQAKLHGIGELAPYGDYKTLCALARTICESVGRTPGGELSHDDMLVAVSTVGTWAEYQRAPIAAQTAHTEDNLPELEDVRPGGTRPDDAPFEGGTLSLGLEAPMPSAPTSGNYTQESNRGYAEPQGRKNARK